MSGSCDPINYRLPGSSVHELQGKPSGHILFPYFPICVSSWSFCYDHDAYKPSITVPHQLINIILNIIFSFFNSLTAHGIPASTVPKSCVYHPRLFCVNNGTAWDPTQNWARRTWPSDFFLSADGVNSATLSAPFVCIPIGIAGLTSEMKIAD